MKFRISFSPNELLNGLLINCLEFELITRSERFISMKIMEMVESEVEHKYEWKIIAIRNYKK